MPSTSPRPNAIENGTGICCHGHRAFVGWLLVWLGLSAARQCFDLLGKLWALVCIDLAQILAICAALSTMLRHRPRHRPPHCCNLAFMATFSMASLALNIALCLWWCTELLVGPEQRERLLSFGLPFGHSFFVHHSPFCSARFNLTTHRWEQPDDCALPFSFFEGLQAILHAIFAAGTFLLAILNAKNGGRQQMGDKNGGENPWEIEEKSTAGKNARVENVANGGGTPHYSGYNLMEKEENGGGNRTPASCSGYMDSLFEQRGGREGPQRTFSGANDEGERRPSHRIVAPIPPIRRSLPRRMEQQKTAAGQRSNGGSSQRRTAIIGNNKLCPSAPALDSATPNYSSLSTVAAAECAAAIGAVSSSSNGPGEFLALIAAANSLSSRSSCSSASANTAQQQNRRRLLQQQKSPKFVPAEIPHNKQNSDLYGKIDDEEEEGEDAIRRRHRQFQRGDAVGNSYGAADSPTMAAAIRPHVSGHQNSAPTMPRHLSSFGGIDAAGGPDGPLKGGNGSTALMVSFDPKASGAELIQWRAHRRTSASDEEEKEIERRSNYWREGEEMDGRGRNAGVEGEKEMAENEGGTKLGKAQSLQSIPSMDAPSLLGTFDLPASASILSQPLPPLPIPIIRHRQMPSSSIDHHSPQIGQHFSDYVPTIGLPPRPLLPSISAADEGNILAAFADCGGPSIYETFLGSGPQDACTSFPVQCGAAPRQSAVQLAAVSAIRLSRHDLLAEEEDFFVGGQQKNGAEEKTRKGGGWGDRPSEAVAAKEAQIMSQRGMHGMLV